jgi:NTE family protein
MEIKNSFYTLVLISLFFALGCEHIETRREEQNKTPPQVKVEPGQALPTNQIPVTQAPPDSTVTTALPQAPQPILGKALPVGVFLGPGAMRSYAEIGVLRALQRAQIPIVVIGGLEWGSIVGASYALGHGANEVEWEMMKLKKEELPNSTFLNRELKPKDPQELFNFLTTVFGSKDLTSGTIPFRCPTTDGDSTEFISQGKAREQLVRCAVLPPLYNYYERAGRRWITGALSPADWPTELRKAGAQFIIYVDVISQGSYMSEKRYGNDPELKALWTAVKAISKQQHLFANLTIEVPSDLDLSDFDHRREMIGVGERAATRYIPDLTRALGINK